MAPRAHYAQLKQAGAVMAPKIINGYGTITYANGRTYTGAFKDGRRHGQGTYTFPNGNKFTGAFKDGLANGQGTLTFANGTKYTGEFKAGRPAP